MVTRNRLTCHSGGVAILLGRFMIRLGFRSIDSKFLVKQERDKCFPLQLGALQSHIRVHKVSCALATVKTWYKHSESIHNKCLPSLETP